MKNRLHTRIEWVAAPSSTRWIRSQRGAGRKGWASATTSAASSHPTTGRSRIGQKPRVPGAAITSGSSRGGTTSRQAPGSAKGTRSLPAGSAPYSSSAPRTRPRCTAHTTSGCRWAASRSGQRASRTRDGSPASWSGAKPRSSSRSRTAPRAAAGSAGASARSRASSCPHASPAAAASSPGCRLVRAMDRGQRGGEAGVLARGLLRGGVVEPGRPAPAARLGALAPDQAGADAGRRGARARCWRAARCPRPVPPA